MSETLIEYGADVNTKENYSGKTALHYAIANENLDIVKLLLENSAEIDSRDKNGRCQKH